MTRGVARYLAIGRLRLLLVRLARAARDRTAARLAEGIRLARAHPAPALGLGVVVAGIALAVAFQAWQHGRTAAQARALLAASRPQEARVLVEGALGRTPGDRELLLLRARALHRIPGAAGEGIDAYAAARSAGPLDDVAHDDLVSALGRERPLADRATRVLLEEGTLALPAILRAAATAPGLQRLRALALARDLGAEDRIDRVQAYGELLGDGDCDVRRAAARRLGEIGDPTALPRLRRAAQARSESKGFLGSVRTAPACGAPEADAAARRIEAARR